ncbi:undecaprenyl-diphosphatase [Radiobacillus deserti]|uniref:Undecaprenyl-diphosphatase n=1 Tax=Radiobacillus deserti TaxID=2594883 RepID=A0A516KKM5_9BACI|nr:undecaprenyl-diphosphatase [Radiobacillus deserti]
MEKRKKERIMVLYASITALISVSIGKIAGQLHQNLQPFAELEGVHKLIEKEVNNSFPSDHTILVFSFCIMFSLFLSKWKKSWVMLASLVGFSRIWVGVHYPGDVIVGAIIATSIAVVMLKLHNRVSKQQIDEKQEMNL